MKEEVVVEDKETEKETVDEGCEVPEREWVIEVVSVTLDVTVLGKVTEADE